MFPGVNRIFTSKALLRITSKKDTKCLMHKLLICLWKTFLKKVTHNQLDFFQEYLIIDTINKGPSLIGGTVSF